MENDMEERGVSISELWRIAKRKIWLIVLAALLFSAAAVLVFAIWINPQASDYKLEFMLTYPGVSSQKYPDGTIFYYQDMISSEALLAAKESDLRFADVDVRSMGQEDKISIERDEDSYILSVQQSYFESRADATAFLRALARLPIETVKEKAAALDFSLNKSVFDSVSFEDKLNLLKSQKERILSKYDEWIAGYSEDYNVSGKSLKNYRMEASVALGDAIFRELMEELETYGYVSRELLEVKIAELREEREMNQKKIKEIQSMMDAAPSTAAVSSDYGEGLAKIVAELIMRNVEIDREIAALTEENVDTFEARLQSEYERMQNAALSIQEVAQVLYEQESRANFNTTNSLSEGGTNVILVGVGMFILVFLIVGGIVCAVGLPKLRESQRRAAAEADGQDGGPAEEGA